MKIGVKSKRLKICVFITMGKVLKLYKTIFTILHLVVIVVVFVVVVQFHTHRSLTVLAIITKLCDFHMEMCIGILNVL